MKVSNQSEFQKFFDKASPDYLIDEAHEVIAREAWNRALELVERDIGDLDIPDDRSGVLKQLRDILYNLSL